MNSAAQVYGISLACCAGGYRGFINAALGKLGAVLISHSFVKTDSPVQAFRVCAGNAGWSGFNLMQNTAIHSEVVGFNL